MSRKSRRLRIFSSGAPHAAAPRPNAGSDSADAHFRVITGEHGRILVAMTHNTDVADSWEREGEDPDFFQQFSPDGYAMGINVLMYALTH